MAEVITKTIISLENLTKYDELIKQHIAAADTAVDAKSLKSLAVVGDTIYLFKSAEVPMVGEGEDAVVDVSKKAFSFEISSSDVTTLKTQMTTVMAATDGYNGENKISTAIGAVDTKVTTLDNSLKAVAKSGAAADVTIADANSKITATTVEGALEELADAVSGLDGDLAAVAKSGTAADVAIADAQEKFTATNVEGALLETANAIGSINTKIGTVAEGKTVMGQVGEIQTKIDGIEEGAQVNIIEEIQFNGTKIDPTSKVVNVVVPKETKNLTSRQIMNPSAEAQESDYHGSSTDYATSAYVYNQLAGILPSVLSEIDSVFDIASNIKYLTVDTKAALDAVDMSEAEDGIYIYLVKQDESQDPKVPADETAGTPAEYYTTMYIYLTTDPESGFQQIGKLNVSEAMLSRITADAIKSALMVSVTDPETSEVTEVTKFYTRTEGAAVAANLAAEVTRATTAEGGLDTRLQAVETAVGTGGSVDSKITTAIEALDATVSTVTAEVTDPVVNVTITEVDGKLTGVSASIKTNTFDAYGAASTAETNAKSYADSLYAVAAETDITGLFSAE